MTQVWGGWGGDRRGWGGGGGGEEGVREGEKGCLFGFNEPTIPRLNGNQGKITNEHKARACVVETKLSVRRNNS